MTKQYTKDSIKARVYKQVAALWGVRNAENTDPALRLLIEALSAELFRLSADTRTIESRLLEKVASALTPHTSLIARPAHAVAIARPYTPTATLLPTDTFTYKSAEIVKKYKLKSLFFAPLCETVIVDAGLKYLVSGGEFCRITPYGEREAIARLTDRDPVMNRKVWLGIKFGSRVMEAGHLRFYVDLPFVSDKSSYLQLLSHCRCTLAGKTIEVKSGMNYAPSPSLLEKYDTGRMLTEEIAGKYDSHFISFGVSGMAVKDFPRTRVPEEIASLLPEDFVSGCDADTVWINMEFPPFFSEEALSQIVFHLNAFVVVNRYPARVNRKIDSVSAVVPLKKSDLEYFLSVDSVEDNHGNCLHEIAAGGDRGSYSVRRGGCERFNVMDARDYLSRLTDLLYDESIAFFSGDKDGVKEDVEQIQEQVARLEQRSGTSVQESEAMSYVIVDRQQEDDTVLTVDYVLTNGEFANGIHAGESLGNCTNPDVSKSSVLFVTPSRGGTPSPSVKRRMDMYRFMLLSHGSIYSKEDIRNFCMAKFGDYINSVVVKLGYAVGAGTNEGFVRTLEVHIGPSENMKTLDREELATDLYNELKKFSPETYNYRILIGE